ncbi:polyphenol oxidase family protein [Candidatus Pacebacteria bacterium]|nr:polyphenol oxidase family protein [Candidatus Paceibacterota bacterium]
MSFRFGEVDEVLKNRRVFLEKNGINFKSHICMACNHGENIIAVNRGNVEVGATSQEEMIEAEVLITQEKNLALMLLTADCIPAIFYDPVHEVIALAHLNRKTITYDLAQKTVSFLSEHFESKLSDLHIHFGPHIRKDSYVFDTPLAEETPPQLTNFIEEVGGQLRIDLTAAFIHQLNEVGIESAQVSISDIDTGTSTNHFSHYRSSRDPKYPSGRLATVLMMV